MGRRAFIGEPSDKQGNAIACARCDRRATTRVGKEPRCSWHVTETLPLAVLRGIRARRKREAQHG